MNIVVFSDLDGTLLDHNTYSYEKARESLSMIKKNNIPLIFTTSKTRAEVSELQKDMEIFYPYIVENGGGVIFSEKHFNDYIKKMAEQLEKGVYGIILGEKRDNLIEFGRKLKNKYDIKLFSEMKDEELIKIMNLPYERFLLSKKREFSEPFIVNDEKIVDNLFEEAKKSDFKILKGGRFYHLVGKYQDKGRAVDKVKEFYEKKYENIVTIGVGDSSNDIDMLLKVDYPILVKRWDGKHVNCNIKSIIKSDLMGPEGFNYEVINLLRFLGVKNG